MHVAVVPVIAGARLRPGQHVCIVDGRAVPEGAGASVGVVSPFVRGDTMTGRRCWVLLYPGSITSLRHEWTHPAFPLEEKEAIRTSAQAEAEAWLREFASSHGADYDDMLQGAVSGQGYWFGEEIYDEIGGRGVEEGGDRCGLEARLRADPGDRGLVQLGRLAPEEPALAAGPEAVRGEGMTARLTRQGVRDLNLLGPPRKRTPRREVPTLQRPMPGPWDEFFHQHWRGTCIRIGCPACGGPVPEY